VEEDGGTPGRSVFVDQREGRRGDLGRVDSQALGEAPDEDGLPAPEVTEEEDDVSRPELPRQLPAQPLRRGFVGADPLLRQNGRASRRTPKAAPRNSVTSDATSASCPTASAARSPAIP
jgi:hypothetical protein